MMALDAKIIKEEILEKDSYDTNNTSNTSSSRKLKGKECRPPDSPEGAVAPHSPMCPQINLSSIVPTRNPITNSGRNEGASPVNSITPPPVSEGGRLLKIRRFLGALVQFGQDSNPDVGDRIRSLVLSLASGGLTVEDFQIAVQEATNFPLRPNILPFLKSHIPTLQRDISVAARATKQTPIQFVRTNESAVLEFVHNPTEHTEFFFHEGSFSTPATAAGGTALTAPLLAKRRASDMYEHANGSTGGTASTYEWDYLLPPSKRASVHSMFLTGSTVGTSSAVAAAAAAAQHLYAGHPSFLDYQNGLQSSHSELLHSNNHRDERDLRSTSATAANEAHRTGLGRDEEWKNIHTMLTCISAMVEKTKRAISILQNRGVEPHAANSASHQEAPLADMKRQTEEKIAEFRRNAEDAVNQVKRQAVIEIQRAVAAAESRAVEMIAQERVKMEKIFSEMNRSTTDLTTEPVIESSPSQVQTTQNACWNCGRKANETCSGCNLARYCGSFCQHKDWEQHHQVCGQSRNDQSKATQNTRATSLVPGSRTSPSQMTSNNPVNNAK